MKILKLGQLPPPGLYRGRCASCGTVVEAKESEIVWEEDRGQDHPTVRCPLRACGAKIYCEAQK